MTVGPNLDAVRAMMRDHGARRLLVKFLSPNDNSKNQVYLGGDFGVVNIVPAGAPVAATSGAHAEPIFKAPLSFSWLDPDGGAHAAPYAQLILYPQYPEVRLSGFLRGAQWTPSEVMSVRDEGRVLLLGILDRGQILGYAALGDTRVARELGAMRLVDELGVFRSVPMTGVAPSDPRDRLLRELCRVHRAGWIAPWRLNADGTRSDCAGTNCIGVTLESELGIVGNARSSPDLDGWEVKGHTVESFDRPGSRSITLMTPEPTGGVYAEEGVIEFVRRFGYPDKRGRQNRQNFGGVHRVDERCAATGLTLILRGYDVGSQTLTNANGELALATERGVVAASWKFTDLLTHWQRKHSRAVFVPAERRGLPAAAYRFGDEVMLAVGTDYLKLLDGLARGAVFYDPGIKVVHEAGRPTTKRRSQFRAKLTQLGELYHGSDMVRACGESSR